MEGIFCVSQYHIEMYFPIPNEALSPGLPNLKIWGWREEFSFSDPPFYSCIRILEFEFEFSNAFEFLNLNLQMLLSFLKKNPLRYNGQFLLFCDIASQAIF